MRQCPAVILALSILPFLCAAAPAQGVDHPLAKRSAAALSLPGLSRLEWGPTTLSYSQAWSSGGSLSQGFLLKELRAKLATSLTFQAQLGMAFTPGGGASAQGEPTRFALPFAALTWRPSDSTVIRLEYSQRSPYGRDLWYGHPWTRSGADLDDLEHLGSAPETDEIVADQ